VTGETPPAAGRPRLRRRREALGTAVLACEQHRAAESHAIQCGPFGDWQIQPWRGWDLGKFIEPEGGRFEPRVAGRPPPCSV